MTCPVCKKEYPNDTTKCEECGFAYERGINPIHLTPEEGKIWFENFVEPYRKKWQEQEAERKTKQEKQKKQEEKQEYKYVPADCYDVEVMGFLNKSIKITKFNEKKGVDLKSIIIPAELRSLPVTKIGEEAFINCKKIENITFPDSLTVIEADAFNGCVNLKDITFPSSLIEIEEGAFYGCINLQNITLPDSLTKIGKEAFYDCNNLKTVSIAANTSYVKGKGCSFHDYAKITTRVKIW